MSPERTPAPADPYATPPRYKNKSGAMIRVAIMAGLLGAGAIGLASLPKKQESVFTAQPEEIAPAQRLADAGSAQQMAPVPLPEATPAPAPVATPAPARRSAPRAAPAAAPTPEPTPPPVTFTEPAPVAPIAPLEDPAAVPPM